MPRSDGNGNWLVKPHTGISIVLVIALLGVMGSAVSYGVGLKTTVDYHLGDVSIHQTDAVLDEQYVTQEYYDGTMALIEVHLEQIRLDIKRLAESR